MSIASGKTSRPLRLLVVTEDDPLYVRQFFDRFFPRIPRDRIELVGVTVSKAFHEPLWKTGLRVLRFFGYWDTIRILPRFIAAKVKRSSISASARRFGFPVLAASSVNSNEYLELVRSLEIDVLVSVAAPEIFKSRLLSVPAIGALNIHSGRLPEYRGMMPTFWQMLHGERHATVTIHEMVERLDAGGIVRTLEFPIRPNDALERIMIGTKRAGADMMLEVLTEIASTRQFPAALPIDMSKARLFRFPSPDDVRRFRRLGHRMLA
jgi:methionyl-tRNA formyltransferase